MYNFAYFLHWKNHKKTIRKKSLKRDMVFFWLSCKQQRAKNLPDALEDKVRDKDSDINLIYLCRYVIVFYTW